MSESPWRLSWRADPVLVAMADRHYPRRMRGAVGLSDQFVAPGTCIVLKTYDNSAGWVSSWPQHRRDRWAGTWVNAFFRNEGAMLSSELIVAAVAHTRYVWGDPPPSGIVTFIDASQIFSQLPGYCYRRAKFKHVGETAVYGRMIFQLSPARMPAAQPVPFSQQTFDEVI
jgi:hypothetical protein